MEIPQRARILEIDYCLKFHNAHEKQVVLLSGYVRKNSVALKTLHKMFTGNLINPQKSYKLRTKDFLPEALIQTQVSRGKS